MQANNLSNENLTNHVKNPLVVDSDEDTEIETVSFLVNKVIILIFI